MGSNGGLKLTTWIGLIALVAVPQMPSVIGMITINSRLSTMESQLHIIDNRGTSRFQDDLASVQKQLSDIQQGQVQMRAEIDQLRRRVEESR